MLSPYMSPIERLWYYGLRILCGLVLLFLVLPVLVIVPLSFNSGTFLVYPLQGFSLRWYEDFFMSADWMRSLKNSLIIAPAATLLAMVFGTLAAIGLTRGEFRGKALVMSLLISPMIGVTSYARYAGLAALPALLPAFAKSAWMNVLPEFNPFKYNSFPVHAARQTYELTSEVQAAFDAAETDGRLSRLPPVLAFQSLADSTVSTPAVVRQLFERLPANGSELVIFDINRSRAAGSLLRTDMSGLLEQLLPSAERDFDLTVVGVAAEQERAVEARRIVAGSQQIQRVSLGVEYPSQLFSLSHVALPFPPSDPLYGSDPTPDENYGVALGTLAPRGEHGVLVVGLDSLQRATSNPFYDYLLQRIEEDLLVRSARLQ